VRIFLLFALTAVLVPAAMATESRASLPAELSPRTDLSATSSPMHGSGVQNGTDDAGGSVDGGGDSLDPRTREGEDEDRKWKKLLLGAILSGGPGGLSGQQETGSDRCLAAGSLGNGLPADEDASDASPSTYNTLNH